MRRTLGSAIITLASLALITVIGASVYPSAVADAAAAEVTSFDGVLGFEVGEERRYVVGPAGAMRDGEEATWSVRLDRVESEGSRSIGVFELTHEKTRWGVSLSGSILVHWKYSGELRVNEFGFPEDLRFSMYEEHTGEAPWRGESMSAEYTLENGGFHKVVRVPDQEWEFDFPIARHEALELDVPEGMFLFRPDANVDFFTNPALLGFALPEALGGVWKQRTLFFRPTYPVLYPSYGYVRNERDQREALRRYYVKATLEAQEETELEIGGRTLSVRKLDITGRAREAYVDEMGRVVRIDIDPDPWTRKNRHIRLLFPSEY
jgi:hypothetical protein